MSAACAWLAWLLMGLGVLSCASGAGLFQGGPPAGEVAFARLTSGYWQVWVADLDAGTTIQRTRSRFDKRYPAWGHDGALFFRSNNDELYRLDPGTDQETPILEEHWPALGPVPGPANALLAFIRIRRDTPDQSAVVVVEPASSRLRHLTPSIGFRSHPAWAPDGDRVAYALSDGPQSSQIREVPVKGGTAVVLVGHQSRNLQPAYDPRGGSLAFVSDRGGGFDVWIRQRGGVERRLVSLAGRQWTPSWSPDGNWIAFASRHGGRSEIWATDRKGRRLDRLIGGDAPAMDPSWRRRTK